VYIHPRVVTPKKEKEMRKVLFVGVGLMVGGMLPAEGMEGMGEALGIEAMGDLREGRDLQTRTLPPINDDTLLSTRWQVETFMTQGESEELIQTETVLVPYPYEEREEVRKAQHVLALVRKYERADGSIFSEDFQIFPLQERHIGTVDNDQDHRTERTFEIFPENNPQRVLETVVRSTPYPFTDRSYCEEIWVPKMVYGQNYIRRTWTRSDGTTFTREWAVGKQYLIRERGWTADPARGECSVL
jgi:hypothetical protein